MEMIKPWSCSLNNECIALIQGENGRRETAMEEAELKLQAKKIRSEVQTGFDNYFV